MVKSNENNAYKRGQELLDQGNYKDAVTQFDAALQEQPDSWKALNSKGFAFQKMSRYTEAVECFDKALQLNPQSVEVLNNKGVTLSMRGLYKDAVECFNKAFDLRVTGDINVTACYGKKAKSVTIRNAEYSRQQYTDAKTGKQVDKLYADFIVAYMDDQGTMLNPEYSSDPETSRQYKSGVIVQYSQNQTLTKPNVPGAKLSEDDKKEFPEGDVLTKENAKELAKGNRLDTCYTYYVSDIANGKYNNRNRLDKALSFNNSETARRLVLCAYYYVWNTQTDEFEMSEPVYFYLYDIGNSVTKNKEN